MGCEPNVETGISRIDESIRDADRYCDLYHTTGHDESDFDSFQHHVEKAFTELQILADALRMKSTRKVIEDMRRQAQSEGMGKTDSFEGEFYSHWSGRIRTIADAIASAYGISETSVSELYDLKTVLKRAVYVICDTALFPKPPQNETDVHVRLEAILRCHYPDLKTKPTLSKPIKNFEPDTGLPSAKTLLEYKFITSKAEAKRAVDQILADASGYRSRDWRHLLFVIYETRRVHSEEQWKDLLKDCYLFDGFDAVVLSGY